MRSGAAVGRSKLFDGKLFRSYATLVVYSGLNSLISFVTASLIARRLSPSAFGDYSVFFSMLVVFWTATNFGDSTYVRFVNAHEGADPARYLRATLFIELGYVCLVSALAWPLSLLLSRYLFLEPRLLSPVLFGILVGSIVSLLRLRAAVYQAAERYGGYATLNSLFYALVLALVASLVVLGIALDPGRLYLVYGGAAVLVFLVSLRSLYRRAAPLLPEWGVIRQLLAFGKWLVGSNIAYVIFQRLDILFVARYATPAVVGQYGAALRVAVLASLFTGSLAPLLLPKAARTARSPAHRSRYLRQTGLLSVSLLIIIAVLWLTMPVVVRVAFGSRYLDSVSLARVLLLGTAIMAVRVPLSQLFFAEPTPRNMFFINWVKLAATLGLLIFLVPRFEARGAAGAVVLAEVVALGYTAVALRRSRARREKT